MRQLFFLICVDVYLSKLEYYQVFYGHPCYVSVNLDDYDYGY